MKVVRIEKRLCPCCMEEHEVQTITENESNVFKGVPVEYMVEYFYCDQAGETYADERQISLNYIIAMKNAYREKMVPFSSARDDLALQARMYICRNDSVQEYGFVKGQ